MATRGRKSTAELALVAQGKVAVQVARIEPSGGLSEAERSIWLRVVEDWPAGTFTETHRDLLDLYAKHVATAAVLSAEVEAFPADMLRSYEGVRQYKALLEMREKESRAASSLATRLRITRQAAVDPKTAGRAHTAFSRERKPWEDVSDGSTEQG
jgi:hypothetical protein